MRKNQLFFPMTFAVYILAGIIAIAVSFTRDSSADTPTEPVETTQAELSSDTDDLPARETDAPDQVLEDTVKPDVPSPDTDTPPALETDTEPNEQLVSDEAIETEGSSEDEETLDSTDDQTDPDQEDDDSSSEEKKIYYGFKVRRGVSAVRVRKTSDRNSEIVAHVDGGDKGYVLEQNDIRSKIVTKDGTVGYIYNEYISISEISKKEVPKKYR